MGGVWEGEIITKNSIIPSQSTLVTKSIFKFSYLEILLADPLCAAYSGTPLKKDPYCLQWVSAIQSERVKNVFFYSWSLVCLDPDILRLPGWAQNSRVRPGSWGRGHSRQSRQAGRRAGCRPHDTAGEEPLESEFRAKADWKGNHTKECNKKKKREKGRIKYVL